MPTDRSLCSKPVTDSEKVTVTSKTPATGPAGPPRVTDGATRSACTEYRAAALLPRPSASWATSAATSTVTSPLADGVIRAVYTEPEPDRFAVPLPTVTSEASNPVTASEKVTVTSNGPPCEAAGPLRVTDGPARSACTEYCAAARLPRPAASWAASAATSTVTVPLADGVIRAVYTEPEPDRLAVPLPTVTSPCSNPVTASENRRVTENGPPCGFAGPLTVTDGASRSACTEYWEAARLPWPAASVAASAATSTVTAPSAAGEIVAV